MKKNILMSVLLLLMGITVYAQEDFSRSTTTTTIVENADKYKVETNRFWSNWFVSTLYLSAFSTIVEIGRAHV